MKKCFGILCQRRLSSRFQEAAPLYHSLLRKGCPPPESSLERSNDIQFALLRVALCGLLPSVRFRCEDFQAAAVSSIDERVLANAVFL